MESVKDSPQRAAPKKILIQGMIDRDIAFQFRDLCMSHQLTQMAGLRWALVNLLTQAGIKVRRDRGDRGPYATQSDVSEESEAHTPTEVASR